MSETVIFTLHDSHGMVYEENGKIFRAIPSKKKEWAYSLLQSDFFQCLMEKGYFPKTSIANVEKEGYDLVLEHEKKFCIDPLFWSYSRLIDAAIFLIRMSEMSEKAGYQLWDARFYNVGFEDCKPFLFDFGAFDDIQYNQRELLFNSLLPLFLMFLGEEQCARFQLSLKNFGYIASFPSLFRSQTLAALYAKNLVTCRRNKLMACFFTALSVPFFFKGKRNIIEKKQKLECQLLQESFINKLRIENRCEEDTFYETIQSDIEQNRLTYQIVSEHIEKYQPDSIMIWAKNPSFPFYLDQNGFHNTTKIYFDPDVKSADLSYRVLSRCKINVDAYLANLNEMTRAGNLNIGKTDVVVLLDALEYFYQDWLCLEGLFQFVSQYVGKCLVFRYVPSLDICNRTEYIKHLTLTSFGSVESIDCNGVIFFFTKLL